MSRWRWAGLLAGLGLFLGVLRQADLSAVWRQILGLQWRFAVVLLVYAVIFSLDTVGWRYALPASAAARIRWDRLLRARMAGEAVNYVTPTAWIGGEPVKALLLAKRHGLPLAEGMASVVVAKTTFALSMFLFIVTGLLVAAATQTVPATLTRWMWVMLPVLGGLLTLFVVVQFLQPFRRSAAVVGRLRLGWVAWVVEQVQTWDAAIAASYRRAPRRLLGSFSFHWLGWMAGVVEVYLILRFLHAPVGWTTAWSIEALWVLLKSGAFMIPGSLGASEGLMVLVCVGLGVDAVSGLALALIRRARELAWLGWGLAECSRR